MKIVSSGHMRELDRRTIEEFGTPGDVLMDRAGASVASQVQRVAELSGLPDPFVQLIAGRGNNGGDVFAAAYHLKKRGLLVEVCLAGSADQVRGDARTHLQRMRAEEIDLHELATLEDWKDAKESLPAGDIIVDGLLGTGAKGPARGPIAGAITYIRHQAPDVMVIAIDTPSGLDADTGLVEGEAVQADVTVTMGLPKTGLIEPDALEYVGDLEVADIGFPDEYIEQTPGDPLREVIVESDLYPLFPRRVRRSHKGDYGHVLMIGGSRQYTGAIMLAARAAMRSGSGLVTAVVPESLVASLSAAMPEVIVRGAQETDEGALASDLWKTWSGRIEDYDALLIGPGMTRHEETRRLVQQILKDASLPIVMDADAISVCADDVDALTSATSSLVLTPHPGEFAALLGLSVKDVQRDRVTHALDAAKRLNATMVLKGAHTVVAQPEPPVHINVCGNPGMATGGTGDVLAGILTSFIGQGLAPFDAARSAVFLHGRAGDMAAWRKTQAGMIATDIIDELPFALRALSMR